MMSEENIKEYVENENVSDLIRKSIQVDIYESLKDKNFRERYDIDVFSSDIGEPGRYAYLLDVLRTEKKLNNYFLKESNQKVIELLVDLKDSKEFNGRLEEDPEEYNYAREKVGRDLKRLIRDFRAFQETIEMHPDNFGYILEVYEIKSLRNEILNAYKAAGNYEPMIQLFYNVDIIYDTLTQLKRHYKRSETTNIGIEYLEFIGRVLKKQRGF